MNRSALPLVFGGYGLVRFGLRPKLSKRLARAWSGRRCRYPRAHAATDIHAIEPGQGSQQETNGRGVLIIRQHLDIANHGHDRWRHGLSHSPHHGWIPDADHQ
jgi:hypothetical protein